MRQIVSRILESEAFSLLLFSICSMGIWLWTLVSMIEAPIFAAFLPEPAKLGCYLGFVKGFGSPAAFLLPLFLKKGLINGYKISLIITFLFGVILTFVWHLKIPPMGFLHHGVSIGLLLITFILAGLDALRYVLFMLFAGSFRSKKYITASYLGPEVMGIMISVLEFLQDVGKENTGTDASISTDFNFGPTALIIICNILFAITCLSFVFLVTLGPIRRRSTLFKIQEKRKLLDSLLEDDEISPLGVDLQSFETSVLMSRSLGIIDPNVPKNIYPMRSIYFMYFMWAACFGGIFNILPPFESYSALPYGQKCFDMTSAALGASGALAIFCAHMLPRIRKVRYMIIVFFVYILQCSVILYIAFKSPHPPFQHSPVAPFFMIFLWFSSGFMGMYLSTTINYNIAEVSEDYLKTGALISNLGRFIGVFIPMILIELDVLKSPLV